MKVAGKIKVLIIDDSVSVRRILRHWISSQDDMEVVGSAADPYVAVEKMKSQRPDVITLDIEMPRMDGLTFLKKLMAQHPIPVIILSSLSRKGSEISVSALTHGAVDIFLKDDIRITDHDGIGSSILLDSIRAAAQASVGRRIRVADAEKRLLTKLPVSQSDKVIVLGASTGGTTAIHDIVTTMPANSPGMVIVQHMPKTFTKVFADRLNALSALTIKEAENGDDVTRGRVLIAPGDKHVTVIRTGGRVVVKTSDGPLVNRHKPSVDVLFESAADQLGKSGVGILLTGMGKDGACGLLSMRKRGAFTIAQDEASSVVYGMPKEAMKLNAANKILPLDQIPNEILLHEAGRNE